jgi:hypothetical protein
MSRGRARAFSFLLLAIAVAGKAGGAGAACVMAKWQGNTLDYVLRIVDGDSSVAQAAAQEALRAKGYDRFNGHLDIRHPQAVSDLTHAHAVVIRATYLNGRNRPRTSYGCGFAATSAEQALWVALRDLQAHSWGWKPDLHGYEIIEQRRY